jgi:two-component system, chemotaxis family, chemotaxis protein CheY
LRHEETGSLQSLRTVPDTSRMARILIIEDDATIAHVLRVLLQTRGHEVLAASNGARGVMSAQRGADVIILDLMMPVMDGFAVLEELNQDEPTAAIPVIVVTAMHAAAVEQRCTELGARRCIRKPFDPETLVEIIEELAFESESASPGSSTD